ncbi:PrsW family intramembrane metalloprotease [Granulicoccus phenolivorans]|uniref:PrsW family intramembrane metalloprotease n=1 Tax=Granulicoccus phenolivorans TaxID=266854 RepID=UPI00040831F1|nr:PrsW family intramembrane metalloprotease [Granulicoccus phenolivorans]
MECPRCGAALPEVAHFCHRCGQDLRTPDEARKKSFAVKPDEPVASFALVSTIMPRGVGQGPQTYRLALTIALVATLAAAIFGALPIAILLAAFSMPLVYIVYVYDVNQWEDEPIPVTILAFLLTGVLAAGFLLLVRRLFPEQALVGLTDAGPTVTGILIWALLVPVVGEVIRQIGPLILASRPQFDDLMDGLTFGVISGVAFASADTLVRYWDLLTAGNVGQLDPGVWAPLIFLEGFVKPVLMGTATGLACAEFSGLGEGYDGFSGRYFRGLGEAILANIVYGGGIYLLKFIGNPTLEVILQLVLALIIVGILVLRIRNVLHAGLMEAAMEAAARQGVGDSAGVGATGHLGFCARCEMPLLEGSAFCTSCGAATRTAGPARGGSAAVPVPAPAAPSAEATETVDPTREQEEGR